MKRGLKLLLKPASLMCGVFVLAAITSFIIIDPPQKKALNKVTTIVIDAGHGGKDPGCSGLDNKEKEVTLSVALKLGKLIEEKLKDVKVIYTRKTDVFVELEERAMIANRNNADLFISIHCNAASYMKTVTVNGKKKKKEIINTVPYGSETYVMGIKNEAGKANVAKRENSAMLLEDNYEKTYNGFDPNSDESYIMMTLQVGNYVEKSAIFAANIQKEYKTKAGRIDKGVRRESLWVLWRTKMPSVLTEVGYLTNVEEEKFLGSEKGQTYLASALFRAFRNYKNEVEGTNLKFNDEIENQEALTNENIAKGDTSYLKQIEDYQDDSDTTDMKPEEKLKSLYKEANQFFSVGDYDNAEKKFEEIKTVKEDEKLAKDKLAEIKTIRTKYKATIAKADKLFAEKKYNDAKKQYDDAQVLMPKEKYPTDKIREIDALVKNGTDPKIDKEKEFNKTLGQADMLYSQKKYAEALAKYKACKDLKPEDDTVDGMIRKCEAELATVDPSPKEQQYQAALKKGDDAMLAGKYAEAKAAYNEALGLKNGDEKAKEKIADCEEKIAEAESNAKYKYAIEIGDKLFKEKNYAEAKKAYQEAIFIKPSEQYPKTQIEKINAANDDPAPNEKYINAMKYGDNYISAKEFIKAKKSFEEALAAKPGDENAKKKIALCDGMLKAGGDKMYNDEVAAGDACFLKKEFACAIDHYKKANTLKPDEDYPKFQIKLSEKSQKWQADNAQYMAIISVAEQAKKAKSYEKALLKYEEGLKFIENATDNKSKFKPTAEELKDIIEELKKNKEGTVIKTNPPVKKDSVPPIKTFVPTAEDVVFKVQFATSEKELETKASKFKGLQQVSYYKMGTTLKYTAGSFASFEEVVAYQDKVRSLGFKDAFAVAFKNGQRIEIKAAVELLKQRKNP